MLRILRSLSMSFVYITL